MDYKWKTDELRRELASVRGHIETLIYLGVSEDVVDALSRRIRRLEESVGHVTRCTRCGALSLALMRSNWPASQAVTCTRCGIEHSRLPDGHR